MAPPKKTIAQYEQEATRLGNGCWIHPTHGIARKIYQLRHGDINDPKVAVCHTCDIPECIEDTHHWLGTWQDNVRDAVRKGRHSCFTNSAKGKFGEAHPFYGSHQSGEARKKIGERSVALWAEVRALGFSSLKQYGEYKRGQHSSGL